MDCGLLWYDQQHAVDEAVPVAAARYTARFGRQPNVCYVHPELLPQGEQQVAQVRVKASARVLKFHFWIGVERTE